MLLKAKYRTRQERKDFDRRYLQIVSLIIVAMIGVGQLHRYFKEKAQEQQQAQMTPPEPLSQSVSNLPPPRVPAP